MLPPFLVGTGLVAAVPVVGLSAVAVLLRAFERSVGIAPPTEEMLAHEPHGRLPLFRHLPALRTKLAWRQLGSWPTPVHDARIATTASGSELHFQVKREDLSSSQYGGNKVRTLEHQLAVLETRLATGGASESKRLRKIGVLGSGGSNQVVATAVHAAARLPKLRALWATADEPDLDNTLNMLSTLSLANVGGYSTPGLAAVRDALDAAANGVLITLGGNSPSGVLGHVSAALELAEQIEAGEAGEVDAIYLACGSSCTISGLIVGVALGRSLGLKAFRAPSFAIHGVIIHHVFARVERAVSLHRSAPFMPLTIAHTVREACATLAALGGPDVTDEALGFLRSSVKLHTDPHLVGKYGAHSARSRAAARDFDARGAVTLRGSGAAPAPPLWLCGHFVAKAYAAMLTDLEENPALRAMLWQTKCAPPEPVACAAQGAEDTDASPPRAERTHAAPGPLRRPPESAGRRPWRAPCPAHVSPRRARAAAGRPRSPAALCPNGSA